MRRIREVLRLHAERRSLGEIALSLNIGKSTVREYVERGRAAGLSWPLPSELDDAALEAELYPGSTEVAKRAEPDWLQVRRELSSRRHHVTLSLLWLEYRQDHPDGYGYTQFCVKFRRWQQAQDLVMRFEYPDGERVFIDFCGDTMDVIDPRTGEIEQAQIFCAVLGASGYMYAEAVRGQDLESWLSAHVRMFGFFAGVAEILVPDNIKSGVRRACWYDPDINPSYLDLAQHFGAVVIPARPKHPRDKAAVEAGVQACERWVLAPLRKHRFFNYAELNRGLLAKLSELNREPFRGLKVSRRDLYLESERAALRPLPTTRYEFAAFKPATVGIDYHVQFDGRFYSVPFRLARQPVEIRSTRSVVEVLHRGQRVASHLREYGRRRYITDREHMPAAHRAHAEWSPQRLVNWAAALSPKAGQVAESILRSKPHPEHGYRTCLGLIRLAKRYGQERFTAACDRALELHSPTYHSVKSILEHALDQTPLRVAVLPDPPEHENLRGGAYYADADSAQEA